MGDKLFAELRRRNVLRVAFVYLVAAWLILQVADLVVPILGVPEWSNKLIFLLLALGFPIAVIMAWAFERTPEGIKKEKEIDRSKSITHETGHKIDYLIIGLLILALAYSLYFRGPVSTSDVGGKALPALAEGGPRSIAVLPLVNMSSDPETDYFSDGLAEELLNLLAKVDSLQVAARTSSFAYKGQDQSIQKIGEELGVGFVLEGSVRRAGDRVRVTTQLISVADGFHLWSETYDRELNDIFELQDEVAKAVVRALRIELLDEKMSPQRTSISPEAYDLFLRARAELNENVAGSLERAAEYLQRAIELEPDYAAAMALLASTYLDMDEFGSLSITESLRLSGPLIERALEIDPKQPDAWVAQGYRQLRMDQDGRAGESLQRALDLAPSHIQALRKYGNVLNSQGRVRQYLEVYRTLARLDPQDPSNSASVAIVEASFGENEQIEETLIQMRERYNDDPRLFDTTAVYYRSNHQFDEMIRDMLRTRALRPADAWAPGNISSALFLLGVADRGEQWLELTRQVNPDSRYWVIANFDRLLTKNQYGELTKLMRDAWLRVGTEANYSRLGSALMLAGNPSESYAVLKESLAKHPYDPAAGIASFNRMSALWLILAARATGDDALANELLAKVGIQVRNIVEQRYYLLSSQSALAAYYALSGERIRALYTLQEAAEKGFAVLSYLEMPFFDELKDNPDFRAILKQVRDNQTRARDKVLALDGLLSIQESDVPLTGT